MSELEDFVTCSYNKTFEVLCKFSDINLDLLHAFERVPRHDILNEMQQYAYNSIRLLLVYCCIFKKSFYFT